MEYDFSGLMGIKSEDGSDLPNETPAGLGPIREAQENSERLKKIYMQQAENIRKAKNLPTEILMGAKKGEDIYSLFFKAVECISLQTGDTVFPKECRKAIEKRKTA